MKALTGIFWVIVAIAFGIVAGLIIGGITLVGGLLILRDAITGQPSPTDET